MKTKQIEDSLSELIPVTGNISPISLELPSNLSQKQWLDIGIGLGRLEQARQWWIGDWWAFGDDKENNKKWEYGQRKAIVESEEWAGPSYETCYHAGIVCRAFKTSNRRLLLSFKHHATLAALKLKPALVEELLDWCEAPLKNGAKKPRSVRQLEEQIIKRHNNDLYDRVITGLDEAIRRHGKPDQVAFDELKAAIILELTNLITLRTKEGIPATFHELEMLRENMISEKLGAASGNLILLIEFIGPIRDLAKRDDFDFDEMVKAEPHELLKDDLHSCETVVQRIETFIEKLNNINNVKT